MAGQKIEGEGNHTAPRKYDAEQKAFAESGKVGPAARDAARAVDGPEAEDLQRAVEEGSKHSHGEDPVLKPM
jgi:hypothetical protein